MEQFAKQGYFIIKYVEDFWLNRAVGIGYSHPQIWFIPDGYSERGRDYQLTDMKQFKIFRNNAVKMLNKYEAQFKIFSKNI